MTLSIEAVRERLRTRKRKEKCDPKCKGWFVNGEKLEINRCDECANTFKDDIDDEDVAQLPEAQFDLGMATGVDHVKTHIIFEQFDEKCPLCKRK